MLLASTHFKPVIGIDFHLLVLPPAIMPLPYIGIVIDPFDYIPYIGGTVKINHVHKGSGLTMGKLITFLHLPKTALPNVGHDSYSLFSSATVKADHGSLAPTNYLCMSCNDAGMPISFSLKKGTFKPLPSMYLPFSTILPIPFGKPVRVGGPYPPDLMALAMNLAFSLGFAYAFKFLGKGAKALLNKHKLERILVVNDASKDRTEAVLLDLEQTEPRLRHVNNMGQHGYGHAVRCGLANFRGDGVIVAMADGSDAPEGFEAVELDPVPVGLP